MSTVPDYALSIWQPHASLICPGPDREPVKTIETRSWATKYRGPVLICSAARPVSKILAAVGDYEVWPALGEDTACMFEGDDSANPIRLPFGAALGVATIVDCLPMHTHGDECAVRRIEIGTDAGEPALWISEPDIEIDGNENDIEVGDFRTVTAQLPYGDFTPGRFGWMLDNIISFAEPIPVKGGQRLWRTDNQRNPNLRRLIAEQLEADRG